jgi:iron(III) transport system permease protein
MPRDAQSDLHDSMTGSVPAASSRRGRQAVGRALSLTVPTALLSLLIAAPLVALLLIAGPLATSEGATLAHLSRTVLPDYALTTFLLAAAVLAIVLVIGVSTGWLIAACDFPGRSVCSWALVLPLAMPAFVMGYAITDFLAPTGPVQQTLRDLTGREVGEYPFPDVHSWPMAALCLGLTLYPYVYLMARTAFAERSASLGEAARSLGLSSAQVWWRVTWPVARPAVVAGAALVLMETLADFGTVSFFAVDTLTAGIFRAWQAMGDRSAAARIALVLLGLVLLLLWLERRQRGRMQFHTRSPRPVTRLTLRGVRALIACLACALPGLLGFVLPAAILTWNAAGAQAPLDPRLAQWLLNTTLLGLSGVLLIIPLALLAAYAIRIAPQRWVGWTVAAANAGYAIPGLVLGIGLLGLFAALGRLLAGLPDGWGLQGLFAGTGVVAVLYAYAVRFFPVGFQGIDAGLKRISPSLDQSARSLGRGAAAVLVEVHWPLMRRTIAVAALLVFVDCVKELPATLVLRPFDFDTLAVVAHHFAADERLAEASLPALIIALIGLLPVVLLSRVALAGPSRPQRIEQPESLI